ncbi:MAG TPA: hypothetical protein VN087_18115 [Verrucomicrobiae bacterium]|jgi:hypothetical protein|nr:hypothetical protein [Verrucomicrobiae bacterium]
MGSESAEEQASITIRRKSPEDVQQRQIIVKLDGENVGELYYGDTISIRVTAGRHKLRVDNTWNWKTVELDVVPGDHLKFQTMSRAGRFSWFLVSLLGAGPIYVSIKREE